jgi:hypothetical protein
MGQWIKFFTDQTQIIGSDDLVQKGLVSWSRSRLDSMIGVTLEHNGNKLAIQGPGEYWQSDTLESVYPGPGVRERTRQIEKKIEACDRFFRIDLGISSTTIYFGDMGKGKVIPISKDKVGQWFILELDVSKGTTRFYIRGTRL